MLLKLRNVGRLEPAEIRIEGLTVVCGNNNTGKSTIGKILYCIFNAFYDIEKKIRREKIDLIRSFLQNQSKDRRFWTGRYFNDQLEELLDMDARSEKKIRPIIEDILKKSTDEKNHLPLQEIVDEIQQILLVDEEEVVVTILKRNLNAEFEGHLGNVNHPRRKTVVDLMIKDDHISFYTIGSKEDLLIDRYMSLEKQVIYMDDPFLLDHINDLNYMIYDYLNYGHSYQISSRIRTGKIRREQSGAIEEVLRNQKSKSILDRIHQISDGELIFEDGKFFYHQANLKKNLGIASLSTGIKTFLILKELLINGDLEENGIMIIDEPEVHLHPEWQIKFAEIIVLLQQAYGLNIILTTHSMDFLSALITYSKKYGIESSCNYYLSGLSETQTDEEFPLAQLKWMNDDIQGLYASVSEPFENLYQQMDLGDIVL